MFSSLAGFFLREPGTCRKSSRGLRGDRPHFQNSAPVQAKGSATQSDCQGRTFAGGAMHADLWDVKPVLCMLTGSQADKYHCRLLPYAINGLDAKLPLSMP